MLQVVFIFRNEMAFRTEQPKDVITFRIEMRWHFPLRFGFPILIVQSKLKNEKLLDIFKFISLFGK